MEWKAELYGVRSINIRAIFNSSVKGRSQDNKMITGTKGVFCRNLLTDNDVSWIFTWIKTGKRSI